MPPERSERWLRRTQRHHKHPVKSEIPETADELSQERYGSPEAIQNTQQLDQLQQDPYDHPEVIQETQQSDPDQLPARRSSTSDTYPTEPYAYGEVIDDEIRVFDVIQRHHIVQKDDSIHIRIRKTSLKKPCHYCTLSYAWGPTSEDGSHLTRTLLCEGRRMKVTESLYAALDALRRIPYRTFPLWADAICINQSDFSERNRQVRMMGDIYRASASLMIWLGEQHSTVRLSQGGLSELDLSQMLASSWFERRWVVQEVVLKFDKCWIISGRSLLPRDDFIYDMYKYGMDITRAKALHRDLSFGQANSLSSQPASLLDNLEYYETAECSDARDYVFSLLSVSADGDAIEIDYTKDVADVYTAVAKHYAENGNVIRLLVCAALRGSDSDDLPSWAPDWRMPSGNYASLYETEDDQDYIRNQLAYLKALKNTESDADASLSVILDPTVRSQSCLRVEVWFLMRCMCRVSTWLHRTKPPLRRADWYEREGGGSHDARQAAVTSCIHCYAKTRGPKGRPRSVAVICAHDGSPYPFLLSAARVDYLQHPKMSYQLMACLPKRSSLDKDHWWNENLYKPLKPSDYWDGPKIIDIV